MAGAGAAVRNGTIGSGHEVPLVAVRQQRQLEYAVLSADLPLAVWFVRDEFVVRVHAAGADDELADATGRIAASIRRLRSKPFIKMIVAVQDEIGVRVVKNLPNIPHPPVVAVLA